MLAPFVSEKLSVTLNLLLGKFFSVKVKVESSFCKNKGFLDVVLVFATPSFHSTLQLTILVTNSIFLTIQNLIIQKDSINAEIGRLTSRSQIYTTQNEGFRFLAGIGHLKAMENTVSNVVSYLYYGILIGNADGIVRIISY